MLLSEGATDPNLEGITAYLGWEGLDMRSRSLLKASDCSGPHDHGQSLCVFLLIASVIAARFGRKRVMVFTNPTC